MRPARFQVLDRKHFLSFLKIRKQKVREANSLTYARWSIKYKDGKKLLCGL